jgi:MYXO-CTERM domain-containing protein
VLLDGTLEGRTRADAAGAWALSTTRLLADGAHTAAARAVDAAGNTGALSPVNRFVVDTVAPGEPTLSGPPSLTNDPTPTASGTAEPGAEVEVYVDGVLVGRARVGDDGNWSLELPALPDGEHTVTAVAVDAAGNASTPAERGVAVDTTAPSAPVISEPRDLEIYLALPPVRGTATPRVKVRVTLDGQALPEVRSTAGGLWTVPLPGDLALGEHVVVAVAVDDAGNGSSPSNQVVFFFGFGATGQGPFAAAGGGCTCSARGSSSGLGLIWVVVAGLVLARRRRQT